MIETHRCEVATRVPEHIQSTPDTCTRTCQVQYLNFKCVNDNNDVGQSRLAFFIVVTLMQAFKCTITCTSTARCLQTLLVLEVDIVRHHNSKTFHLSFRLPTTSRTGHNPQQSSCTTSHPKWPPPASAPQAHPPTPPASNTKSAKPPQPKT